MLLERQEIRIKLKYFHPKLKIVSNMYNLSIQVTSIRWKYTHTIAPIDLYNQSPQYILVSIGLVYFSCFFSSMLLSTLQNSYAGFLFLVKDMYFIMPSFFCGSNHHSLVMNIIVVTYMCTVLGCDVCFVSAFLYVENLPVLYSLICVVLWSCVDDCIFHFIKSIEL